MVAHSIDFDVGWVVEHRRNMRRNRQIPAIVLMTPFFTARTQ
jgi:hypothetical protein